MDKKKVLIVEDEMIISLLIEKMVQNLGHEVVGRVSSGEEAVEAALKYQPDLILMDIRLDGKLSGIEAATQIHEHMHVPVIYISGNTDMLANGYLRDSDYVTFLPKPVTLSDLSNSFSLAS